MDTSPNYGGGVPVPPQQQPLRAPPGRNDPPAPKDSSPLDDSINPQHDKRMPLR